MLGSKWTLPNIISLSRIIVVPILIYLLDQDTAITSEYAAIIFVAAGISDWVDGFLARRHNTVSQLGKLLDPLADKLMVISVLVMLLALHRVHYLYVIILIMREFAISSLRAIATEEGVVISASTLAKYKTAAQIIALVCLILGRENRWFYIAWFDIGEYFLIAATLLALISAYQYFTAYRIGSMSISAPKPPSS